MLKLCRIGLAVGLGLWGTCTLGADGASTGSSPVEALRANLKRLSINAPLAEAIQQLGQRVGIQMNVDWSALQDAGVHRDTPVVLNASAVSPAAALSLMLDQVSLASRPLGWRVQDGSVLVSTQMRLLTRDVGSRLAAADKAPLRSRPSVGVDFSDAPLESVIEHFRRTTGVNFFANWGALEKVGVRRDTPVSLSLRGVSTARALDLLTEQLSDSPERYQKVYWVLDNGVIMVSTGEALDTQLRLRVCDISDLLAMPPHRDFNFEQPQTGQAGTTTGTAGAGQPSGTATGTASGGIRTSTLQTGATLQTGRRSQGQQTAGAAAAEPPGRDQQIQTLIRVIEGSIGQEMWAPEGKGSIAVFNNQLIISQTLLGFKLMENAVRR